MNYDEYGCQSKTMMNTEAGASSTTVCPDSFASLPP
jgi:hypothetical protein